MDVRTRWNSTYEAICRITELKETVIAFGNAYAEDECPKLNKDVFRALEVLKPVLAHFQALTKRYSKVDIGIHRSMVDLHLLIQTLKKSRDKAAVDRQESFRSAIDKLTKYMLIMLQNDWICGATILDPYMKEEGLTKLLKTYDVFEAKERTQDVVNWLLYRADAYRLDDEQEVDDEEDEDVNLQQDRVDFLEQNPFSSIGASQQSSQSSGDSVRDAWNEYTADSPSDTTTLVRPKKVIKEGATPTEHIAGYWNRQMKKNRRLQPLARVARDILAVPCSSTCVERLFSQSGNTLGGKRKSMKAEMVLKQTATKIWGDQGFSTLKDVELLC
jgi:hypothetical protein